MKVYDLDKYREIKEERKVVTIGDFIVWHCPIFDVRHAGYIDKIYDIEFKHYHASVNLTNDDGRFTLILKDGTQVASSLFIKKSN